MPTIPLWLGLAAAIPLTWSPLQVYFIITLIVSLFGWTGLAREVRGRFFALRSEDFVTAARLDGSSERRLIFRHILPSLTSHILAVVTLALPIMIVAETALSFLGIGLKPPVVSWGVLLQDAQNVRTIATAPWLLIWPAGRRGADGARLQLPRRRHARRRRPLRELRAMRRMESHRSRAARPGTPLRRRRCRRRARRRESQPRFPPAHRHPARRPRRELRAEARQDALPRRRERLGEERHRPRHAAHPRQERQHHERAHPAPRRRLGDRHRAADASAARSCCASAAGASG